MKRTHYETLGIPEAVSADEIKAAFRARARETHPDRNAGSQASEAAFKEVNEAYQVLGDAMLKAAYDGELGMARFRDAVARAAAAARSKPVPAPSPRPSFGKMLGLFAFLGVAGGALSSAFGGSSTWDSSVGRYRGPDGRFTSG